MTSYLAPSLFIAMLAIVAASLFLQRLAGDALRLRHTEIWSDLKTPVALLWFALKRRDRGLNGPSLTRQVLWMRRLMAAYVFLFAGWVLTASQV